MSTFNEGVQKFDTAMTNWLSVLNTNENFATIVTLILIVYAGLLAPRLPESIILLFDHPIVKLILILLIAYIAKVNPTVAIIASIAFLVTLQALNRFRTNKMMMALVDRQQEKEIHINNNLTMPRAMTMPMPSAMPSAINDNVFEEAEFPTKYVAEDSLQHLQEEDDQTDMNMNNNMHQPPQPQTTCNKKVNYRNDFYPQYVNLNPESYLARDNSGDVPGYDEYAGYASNKQ